MASKIEALMAQQEAIKKQIAEARKAEAKKREQEIIKLIRKYGLADIEFAQLETQLKTIAAEIKQREQATQPKADGHAFG